MVQRVRRQVHESDLVKFGFCTCGRHAHAVFRALFGESQVPSGRAIEPARALRMADLLLVPVDGLQVLHKLGRGQRIQHDAWLMAAVQLRRPRCRALALRLAPPPPRCACLRTQ